MGDNFCNTTLLPLFRI